MLHFTVIIEGKPVFDAGVFWRVISEHKVKSLFTAPTAIRAKEDPNGEFFKKYDLSKFDKLFLAGERADPDTIKWFEKLSNSPVIDHWWQTENSWQSHLIALELNLSQLNMDLLLNQCLVMI